MTRPILRPRAEDDLVERTQYYRAEGGSHVGGRFFRTAIGALDAIGRMPGAGSPQLGEMCGIDGLRVRRVPDFPCDWFYFVTGDRVDVVRLLADAQDIAAILGDIEQR
ncbi:MAG: type II toxin-antitoxin system RelE/ParE family toxin [Ilumatobacter sp.]|uniref:type II toxin-antitoxin system RelE/ParE family toxin n=1 Tax=Ilumatobacter sp. TaxID=1967498 RepID=UPI0032995A87